MRKMTSATSLTEGIQCSQQAQYNGAAGYTTPEPPTLWATKLNFPVFSHPILWREDLWNNTKSSRLYSMPGSPGV